MKLGLIREDLAGLVAAAVPLDVAVVDYVPDQIAVPAVYVGWGSPMLEPSTMCDWTARPVVTVVAARLEPGAQLGVVEDLIGLVLGTLRGGRVAVEGVEVYVGDLAGVTYLFARIPCSVDLSEE